MRSNEERESWLIDQITKSNFFHQKLHDWNLLKIAYELDTVNGEKFEWNLNKLDISLKSWNKVIHSGIKPVKVFCHPEVLKENPKRVIYYRMLAMVSQKSMSKVGLTINKYEEGRKNFDDDTSLKVSKHLNKIISILIESDEKVDEREFDLWRGMAAGSQAQGSWQNLKGRQIEVLIKEIIKLISKEIPGGEHEKLMLKDGRMLVMGSDPDIGIYEDNVIQVALEIKGGIDPAGVHERFGAALKSLRRAKQGNPKSITILIMQGISLTIKAREEINKSKEIEYFFTIENIIGDEYSKERLFDLMGI